MKDLKLFLLDMDGTIYLDDYLFDGVTDFLAHVKSIGGRYIFLTNNSSKSVDKYVEKLNKLGIKADKKDFATSAQATALYLNKHFPNKKIYCMGTKSMIAEMEKYGVNITTEADEDTDCICVGYDTELTYKKLWDVSYLLQTKKDIPYIATNPDRGCPTEFGLVPDCFAMCEAINYATNRRPIYIGKPDGFMIDFSVERSPFSKEEAVVIGDRLYTDIASGYNAGIDTIFVLSGEGKADDIEAEFVLLEHERDTEKCDDMRDGGRHEVLCPWECAVVDEVSDRYGE